MRGALLLTVLLPASALAQDLTAPHVLTPFGVVVNVRTQRAGKISRTELVREISEQLRAHTDFELIEIDAGLVRRCVGKLACMVADVRQDQGTHYPRYLLVITHFTHEEMTERLSVLLIDAERALQIYDGADREDPDWAQAVETSILSSGAMVPEQSTDVFAVEDGLRLIRELMDTDFRRVFASAGHWHPFGTIELSSEEPGALVLLDDVQLGVTRAGLTRIVGVLAGPHQLRVEPAGFEPFVAQLEVKRDEITTVTAHAVRHLDPTLRSFRRGMLWSGVAIAAAGAALVVYSAVKPSGGQGYCLHSAEVDCESKAMFARFGSGGDSAFESGNGSGPPIAPIGIGLAGMGAVWSLGTWLFGAEDDVPWIQALVGAGVFGLALGLGFLLDGDDPLR